MLSLLRSREHFLPINTQNRTSLTMPTCPRYRAEARRVQLKDGPNAAANTTTLVGSTAITVPAVGSNLLPTPLFFPSGIQVVTAGATGELDVDWY